MAKRTWGVALIAAFTAGLVALPLVERMGSAQGRGEGGNAAGTPADRQPGTHMSIEELKAKFFAMSGGRRFHPKSWPNGAKAALTIAFDTNATGALVTGSITPNEQQQDEFGARDGLPRVLKIMDRHKVPGTFFVPAVSAIMFPDMIPSIIKSGRNEVALHGWMHENYFQLSEEEQKRLMTQAIDYLTKATGKRPVGFVPPGANTSVATFRMAKEAGLLYMKAYGSDDPYELMFDGKPSGLFGVPGDWNLNDATFLGQNGALPDPDAMYRMWRREFDQTYAEGGLMVLTLHPPSTGRRGAALAFDDFITYVQSKPGVWIATAESVVNYVKTAPETTTTANR